MNAYELAELRVMLDSIGMRNWEIRYAPPFIEIEPMPKFDALGMLAEVQIRQRYYFLNRGNGYTINVYRVIDPGTGKPYLWHVMIANGIAGRKDWQWQQRHTELEKAMANIYVQLHKAGIE